MAKTHLPLKGLPRLSEHVGQGFLESIVSESKVVPLTAEQVVPERVNVLPTARAGASVVVMDLDDGKSEPPPQAENIVLRQDVRVQ